MMTVSTMEKDLIAASDKERPALEKLADALRTNPSPQEGAKLVAPSGEEIPLPASLYEVLEHAAGGLMHGEAVAIVPVQQVLTTRQAVSLLNVSRQYLVQLLDNGVIPFAKTGTHRRIKFGDILDYQKQRDAQRRRGLGELTRKSADLGLSDGHLGDIEGHRSEPP